MPQQPPPPVGQDLLITDDSQSHSDTPHWVGIPWTSDRPDAENLTWQRTNTHKGQTTIPKTGLEPKAPAQNYASRWVEYVREIYVGLSRNPPPNGPGPPHFRWFTIPLRHTTLGRNPLDEWSSRRTELNLTNTPTLTRRDSNQKSQHKITPWDEWNISEKFMWD